LVVLQAYYYYYYLIPWTHDQRDKPPLVWTHRPTLPLPRLDPTLFQLLHSLPLLYVLTSIEWWRCSTLQLNRKVIDAIARAAVSSSHR
jgi:hypothetical protein